MAQTKTYKGKKSGYYPETPARHEARLDTYYIGPLGSVREPHGMQNEAPSNADPYFGKPGAGSSNSADGRS